MKLTDIGRSHVNAWVADLTKAGRGAVTVRRALSTLQVILSTAVRDEIIPASPASTVDKPAVPDSDPAGKHWEPGPSGSSWSGVAAIGSARCSS